jgi:hypothetical protein
MSNRSTKTDNDDFDEGTSKQYPEKQQTMNVNFLLNGIKNRNVKRVFI